MHSDLTGRGAVRAAAFLLFLAVGSMAAAQTPTESDLQALRFYLAEDNEDAVRSELRRLQIEYPSWEVPDDLTELKRDVPGSSINRIYSLIEQRNFAAAREAINQTAESYPDWSPSADLLETLAIQEAQSNFDDAIDMDDGATAIEIARSNPALLRCERVNNAWLLAERYAEVGEPDTALRVYDGVVRTCTDVDILIATLEKAAAYADPNELGDLADAARGQVPSAEGRIDQVEDRLRAGMGAPAINTSSAPGTIPLPRTEAAEGGRVATSSAVAAPAPSVSVTAAPAMSLRPVRRPADLDALLTAPAIARQRDSTPSAPVTSARASSSGGSGVLARARSAAERGDWRGCVSATSGSQQADVVAQRGWCVMNIGRPMQALADFRRAASSASTARARIDSSYGAALAMLQLNMIDEAAQIAATTHFTADQRREIEGQILDKRGVAAYERGDFRRAIAYFDELERVTGTVRRDLALLRGYAYLNSGQRQAAKAEFMHLHNQMATPATRRALSRVFD